MTQGSAPSLIIGFVKVPPKTETVIQSVQDSQSKANLATAGLRRLER
jgi:hypothetical protein